MLCVFFFCTCTLDRMRLLIQGKTINCLELWQKYYLVAQDLKRSYTTMTRKKTNNDNITIAIVHKFDPWLGAQKVLLHA